MSDSRTWKLMIAIMLAMVTVAFALSLEASARPMPRHGGHGGPGGPGRFRGLHFGPLVQQLVFPCRNDCTQADRSCHDTAKSAALACAEETCDATIDGARTNCAADRVSSACLTDVSALITCLDPCITAESAALQACAETHHACVDACSATPTP